MYHRPSETSAHFSTKGCPYLIMLIVLFDHVSTIFVVSNSSGVRWRQRRKTCLSSRSSIGSTTVIASSREYQNIKSAVSSRSLTWQLESFTARFDHLTPTLRDRLHWLRVPASIQFKRCLLVYKALHGSAPAYITEYCTLFHQVGVYAHLCNGDFAFHAPPRRSCSASDPSLSVARVYGTTYRTQ